MKQIKLFSILIIIGVFLCGTVIIINSSVYEWANLKVKKTLGGEERSILSGPTQSLEMFIVKAVTLNPGQKLKEYEVEKWCDELLIIKEGNAKIAINGNEKTLDEGSIIVASQGDKVKISNDQNKSTTFYSFVLKPKVPAGGERSSVKVPAVMKDWNSLEFKASANGGRRDILKQPTSSLKELEMHTTTLNEGLPSHAAHTHPDEEIILVRFGSVEQTINGKAFKLGPGSVIFLSNQDNHGIANAGTGKCEYYAIRWLITSEPAK